MDQRSEFSWAVGGQAGEGIDTTGELFALALQRLGYFVYAHRHFPSRIRGGYTSYKVRVATRPVHCEGDWLDCLVAFDQETVDENLALLPPGAAVVHDDTFPARLPTDRGISLIPAPMTALAREAGSAIMKNMVATGVSAALLGLPKEPFLEAVERRFGKKSGKLAQQNRAAVDKGYAALAAPAPDTAPDTARRLPPVAPRPERLFLSGNEAMALGAMNAGCRFFAGYPITPATEIMLQLIKHLPRLGGAVVQTEDEIAAITMVVGAGYGGVRAMTATSGPGFSLMLEALGLAGMTETPIVVVDVQRGGPSTGLPTKSEQGDLHTLLYGGHGEFPRIVLAPRSREDCFYMMQEAFNLAEGCQCPVLVASDLALGMNKQTVEPLDFDRVSVDRGPRAGEEERAGGAFRRYRFTPSGVSPRAIPGDADGRHLATGDEHDEAGEISEDPENRTRMMRKRLGKPLGLDLSRYVEYQGPASPALLLVGWGSTWGVLAEVRERLARSGQAVGHLHLAALQPFPADAVVQHLAAAARVLVVENNATGQLAGLLRRELATGAGWESCLKYDGNPFRPREVEARARQALAAPLPVQGVFS